jgi:engulfment and cell motility protein 2
MQELFSSPRWAALGFQGRNPATDFRGAGLFGLQCLHYLVGLEPRVVRRMAQREHGSVLHYLPFAIAGLNLAFTLLQALQLSPPADRGAGGADPLLTPTEAEVHLAFCALLAQEQFAFEEIFRSSMLYLEELWTDTHAQYSQFNAVLLAVRERVETTLLRRPLSMDEFARLLQEGDDGEGGLM